MRQFRNNLFLGTTRSYLTALHDPEHNNLYSNISAVIVPCGFLFVTVVGWVMDKYGFAITGHCVNVLGLLYGTFMTIPVLWAQPISSFFFAFYRALLFSFVAAFTAVVFGPKAVGRITGILYTTCAFFILLITPMVNFTTNHVRVVSSCAVLRQACQSASTLCSRVCLYLCLPSVCPRSGRR